MRSALVLVLVTLLLAIAGLVSAQERQWFYVKFLGTPYSNAMFIGCMQKVNPQLNGAIKTVPDARQALKADPSIPNGTMREFKFAWNDENWKVEQRDLATYLKVAAPNLTSLKNNCYSHSYRMNVATMTLTTAPSGSSTTDNSAPSTIIPGLKNWMAYVLFGVGGAVVLAIIFFVSLSWVRSQQVDADGAPSTKQFSPHAGIKAPELEYQRAKTAGDIN